VHNLCHPNHSCKEFSLRFIDFLKETFMNEKDVQQNTTSFVLDLSSLCIYSSFS